MRCLSREPRGRPADASVLARELGPGTERPTVRLDPATRVLPRRGGFGLPRVAYLVAGLLAAALLALIVGMAARGDDGTTPAPREPARIAPVPAADDPAGQARSLEQWIRDHTKGN